MKKKGRGRLIYHPSFIIRKTVVVRFQQTPPKFHSPRPSLTNSIKKHDPIPHLGVPLTVLRSCKASIGETPSLVTLTPWVPPTPLKKKKKKLCRISQPATCCTVRSASQSSLKPLQNHLHAEVGALTPAFKNQPTMARAGAAVETTVCAADTYMHFHRIPIARASSVQKAEGLWNKNCVSPDEPRPTTAKGVDEGYTANETERERLCRARTSKRLLKAV